jgi:hypothetical protein
MSQDSQFTFINESPGTKNVNGQGLKEVLLDIIKDFPKYNLESKEGVRHAVKDMAERINEVTTSFDENFG